MKYCPVFSSLAGVEHLHDVRVNQACGGLRLALETRDERRILGEVLGEQLDGHLALQAQIEGEVDGGHPAETESALQAVAPGDLYRRSFAAFLSLPAAGAPDPACVAVFIAGAGAAARSAGRAGGAFVPRSGVPPPGVVAAVVVVDVVGVVVVAVWVVVVGVVWVLVVVFGVLVVVVARGERLRRTAPSARRAGWRCPGECCCAARVDRRGQGGEVLFGFGERRFGGGAVRLRRSAAACATASKSLCSGPALAAGISPLPELPQATSSAAATPSSPARQQQRSARDGAAGGAGRDSRSLTVLQALGERVGEARGADRRGGAGDVVVGAVEGGSHSVEVEQQPGGARVAVARLPDAAGVQQPFAARRGPAVCPRVAVRRWRARPRGARRRAHVGVADQADAVLLRVQAELGEQG